MRAFSRRGLAFAAAATAGLVLAACSGGNSGAGSNTGDMAIGAPEGAAVTVVEYASVTCGVCAAWNRDVMPAFKAKYVDTNQVRFVFRELPTPPQDVAAAGFLLARCAPEGEYFNVVDRIMRAQTDWQAGTPPLTSLQQIAQGVGLNQEQFQQCVTDEAALTALNQRVDQARADGVTGTPTFMVNGEKVSDITLEGLSAAIDPLLAAQ
ncbi:DsbA family protein [Brevundimonas sp.]|uniref:DsbA family protein n=1 Tax=Brevundimonas sp. TaxID=1871086 RepID=UPI0035ADAE7F